MKFIRSGYGIKALLVLLCFGIQYGLLDAKAIKKSKHAVHKSGSQKNNIPKGNFCINHSYCVKYSDLDCASAWVEQNCPRMCRVCEYEGPDIMQLPAVLYVKKGNKKHGISGKRKHKSKHATEHKVVDKRDETPGGRRDVVFLKKQYDYTPTERPPTTSYNLFDYTGHYRKWLFMFPDQHPVNLHYIDQGKAAADANQQTTGQQQTVAGQDAAGMSAFSAGVATPTLAPAAYAAAQPAAPAVAAAPVAPAAPAAAVPAAPIVAQPAAEVPQVGQVAAAVQQLPVAVQQPVAAQAAAAAVQPLAGTQPVFTNQSQVIAPANQTIELINQTVSLAANNTQTPVYGFGAAGFEPNVANVTQTNGTVMAGAFVGDNTSNQTFATGNSTSQNQTITVYLVEPLSQNSSFFTNQSFFTNRSKSNESLAQLQTNETVMAGAFEGNNTSNQTFTTGNSTSQNQTEFLVEPLSQNSSFFTNQSFFANQSKSNKSLAQLQSGAQHLPEQQSQSFVNASRLHQDEASTEESLNTSPPVSTLPSSFHLSGEEVTSEHKLHVDNTDASSEMQGHFNPNGASVTLSGPGTVDLTSTGQSFTQDVTVDSDGAAQTPWTCCNKNVKPPKDCKPCPKLPKAPPLPYVFNIYCDDLYKDCAYGYSNCNDTWWQINCPKTCNLCKAKDKVTSPKTKAILPSEVKDLDTSELESDLVAPVPGEKPLVAKYTLRVKPKLLNGVPQMQEIRIMPPNMSGASGFVKPLMVLKQNITKPMIENIEIDVPKKGAKYSRKPSVEVIEGDHKEILQVSKGQAVVEDASQKSKTKPEEIQETKPAKDSEASTQQVQSTSTNTTEEDSAAKTSTVQTQSTSTTTPEQDSATQTATAQAQSASTTQTDAQSTASYQQDTQTQSASTTQPDAQSTVSYQQDTQTQSASTTQPDPQSTASYQQDTQTQSSSTAPATQTAAYSNTETCTDDSSCATYAENQCADAWLMTNCKSKCKLC